SRRDGRVLALIRRLCRRALGGVDLLGIDIIRLCGRDRGVLDLDLGLLRSRLGSIGLLLGGRLVVVVIVAIYDAALGGTRAALLDMVAALLVIGAALIGFGRAAGDDLRCIRAGDAGLRCGSADRNAKSGGGSGDKGPGHVGPPGNGARTLASGFLVV